MISFEEARRRILKRSAALPKIRVALSDAAGYVLAESVTARENIPPFDASAVDGYGVNWEDIASAAESSPVTLQLLDVVKAGEVSKKVLHQGSCIKLMTGAMIPAGVDTVVMQEFVEEVGRAVRFRTRACRGDNVRRRGEEFAKGTLVLREGTFITPPVVGLLATVGRPLVRVYRKPRVALILTGTELVPADKSLKVGKIRDSNSPALVAALRAIDVEPQIVVRVADTRSAITRALSSSLRTADAIMMVGGVSVGDFDYVKEIAGALDVERIFWKVAIKPGKPFFFGAKSRKLVFGLPGNPVSALVTFYLFVVPALRKMMGSKLKNDLLLRARLEHFLSKNSERMEFVRGLVRRTASGALVVSATQGQDSHMLGGLATANCIIYLRPGKGVLPKNKLVDVQILSWNT
ncbi:MAG: gephyrin-like molybdotransferase Glp [Bacteroidota bacterium]